MKLSLAPVALAFAAITPAFALPEPVAAPAEPTLYTPPGGSSLEKRNTGGTVEVDGLRYRTCPRTSCPAIGQYPIGTHVEIVCYTRDNTTPVNGDYGWALLTNGYWVALSWGSYVSWYNYITTC